MQGVNWRRHQECFEEIADSMQRGFISSPQALNDALSGCTAGDPASSRSFLGVSSFLIAYLEYLFWKADGPYFHGFEEYALLIQTLFSWFPELRSLIDHNAPDALGNMILNRRGRLKFSIADQAELGIILDWWRRFHLLPVTPRQVLDAILGKSTIRDRIEQGDPRLILRLIDVFPEFEEDINPENIPRDELIVSSGAITPPPSERRYRRILEQYLDSGGDIRSLIGEEERRILPMQMKRNRFLAFLVRQEQKNTCQICKVRGEVSRGPVAVHHIVPLSLQGKDRADNMLVTCAPHHAAIHAGEIVLTIRNGDLLVRCTDGEWEIDRGECCKEEGFKGS